MAVLPELRNYIYANKGTLTRVQKMGGGT